MCVLHYRTCARQNPANIATVVLLAIKTHKHCNNFWILISLAHCCYFSTFPCILHTFSFVSECFKSGAQNFIWPLFQCLKECSQWKANWWAVFPTLILMTRHLMQIGCQNIHETMQFVIKTCILLQACYLQMFRKRSLWKVTDVLGEWRTGFK